MIFFENIKCLHGAISVQAVVRQRLYNQNGRNHGMPNTFCNIFPSLIKVPLGSIPKLPAYSCKEILSSEGKVDNISKYWLDPNGNGTSVLVYCDMNLEGY